MGTAPAKSSSEWFMFALRASAKKAIDEAPMADKDRLKNKNSDLCNDSVLRAKESVS